MSTNRFFSIKVKQNFEKFFDKTVINRIGRRSGFIQRKSRKISAFHFVLGFIFSCAKGGFTFSEWAFQISMLSGKKLSKQGIFERVSHHAVLFAQQLVEHVLIQKSKQIKNNKLFTNFKRVLLQDSTILKVPKALSVIFPGSSNQKGKNASVRVQSIIDIKAMKFIRFVLGAFTQNDQSASMGIVEMARPGDLIIRDLGYFSIACFEKLLEKQVHFLSRLRYGVTISDRQGNPIRLKKLLGKKVVDRWVLVGSERKILVRLVVLPVPAAQAAQKVRKAKQDRDRRLNHSREYYQWMAYNVYITSVDREQWSGRDVLNAYRTRWQIEIVFKSWKTGFNLQEILHEACTNENRVRVSIWLMLLFICLFMQKIYLKYRDRIKASYDQELSILKLSVYVSMHFKEVLALPDKLLPEFLLLHCCYEHRTDRVNMTQFYRNA